MQVAEAKALACHSRPETGVPLARWSCPELVAELTARGVTDTISASTVRRWLRQAALKPWQYQSWIFIRDPDFRAKAQPIPDLYARTYEGEPLGRARDLQRREDLGPGPLPMSRDPRSRPGQGDARQPRVRPRRRRGLPGRLRRPPGESLRPLRGHHRHHAVHGPGRTGHDHRALRQRQTRLLDRRQRLISSLDEGN
ncbi:hypothetical protein ACFYNW_05475 [Streptomyces virginiae]|uniref:hypothetical protein n=1 Tax=Streptomyces virginiae TaxID=1961 RepID=UPI0033BC2814